jgi:hypothetical protein
VTVAAVSAHMGFMRTLDRNYLATHPKGDEKATLTLELSIPASIDIPNNPDGTRPAVTLKATGGTYLQLAQALSGINEDEGTDLLNELVLQVLREDDIDEMTDMADEAAARIINACFHEVVVPFRTFTVGMTMESTGSFGETEVDFVFEITAPSLAIAHPALVSMTRPGNLSQILVGWCPETEDDEEYGNEVLVVS